MAWMDPYQVAMRTKKEKKSLKESLSGLLVASLKIYLISLHVLYDILYIQHEGIVTI